MNRWTKVAILGITIAWGLVPAALYACVLAVGDPQDVWASWPRDGQTLAHGLGWTYPLAWLGFVGIVSRPALWRFARMVLTRDNLAASLSLLIPALLGGFATTLAWRIHPIVVVAFLPGIVWGFGRSAAGWVRGQDAVPKATWSLGWAVTWRYLAMTVGVGIVVWPMIAAAVGLSVWPGLALVQVIADPEATAQLRELSVASALAPLLRAYAWGVVLGMVPLIIVAQWFPWLFLPGHVLRRTFDQGLLTIPGTETPQGESVL